MGDTLPGLTAILTVELTTGAYTTNGRVDTISSAVYTPIPSLDCLVACDYKDGRTLCINPETGTNTTLINKPVAGANQSIASWIVTKDTPSSVTGLTGSLLVITTNNGAQDNYQLAMYVCSIRPPFCL
jgi:hypothetical protein